MAPSPANILQNRYTVPSVCANEGRQLMPKVSMTTNLNASADQVWQMIGRFNALPDWHPSVEKSELTEAGQTRTLSLVGGGKIV